MTQEPLIRVDNVSFAYRINQSTSIPVLRNVSFSVMSGEYVAIIGHNGSGKSTLSKMLNGILVPETGDVWVSGMNTREKALHRQIRQCVGMVFQHPDNQIVATIVEDDIAFGLENIGVPPDEMKLRVDEALQAVGMSSFRDRPPHHLSGGQKQRVAIAGILAMKPSCIVLDEATSMLDSYGRKEILAVVGKMRREGMTIVTVTHHMSEVAEADRVIVLEEGEIVLEGTPREVFRQHQKLQELHLDVPQASQLALRIHELYPAFQRDLIQNQEIIEEVERHKLRQVEVSGR
ncbi:energy-coupling factor transporter ATPase [Brevibacillus humidisoli]|uniref:energy-coupling factor transporter ATPase n=1 Tax=Brevibacillus humidisoli TaxID=2895522 RepID=UPI001E31D6F5|nr:energy-coupling factor transporter ATPase [Brevibacillus humidisoli]UFJ42375.1 energy-coupling factor transporter ATPase [Brevibacillus humidisoli]